jgi:hypothetical protein
MKDSNPGLGRAGNHENHEKCQSWELMLPLQVPDILMPQEVLVLHRGGSCKAQVLLLYRCIGPTGQMSNRRMAYKFLTLDSEACW